MSADSAPNDLSRDRDQHLFGPGRKRILSIDGGGVRGVLAIGFIERLEAALASAAGRPVRICDHFDLIGGTSTGAIIASALALGLSSAEIRSLYYRLGPSVFRKPLLRLPGWQSVFDARALRRHVEGIVGTRALDSPDLRTGLAVLVKRIDAGSSWILTNNSRGKFWDTPSDQSFIGNRHYLLASIIRASTAAPHYFDPQDIQIVEGEPSAIFVDGGLTPHNDPSLALFLLATLPSYNIQWRTGADALTIVSIGTGTYRTRLSSAQLRNSSAVTIALRSLMQQITDNQQQTLTLMSWLGKGGSPWPINMEIGDLSAVEPAFGALFRFFRYDIRLESDWLRQELDTDIGPLEMTRIRRFDDPGTMARLDELGRKAALRQVREADLANA
jgi:uncharacterized protein